MRQLHLIHYSILHEREEGFNGALTDLQMAMALTS
jgi:hypothetical protein